MRRISRVALMTAVLLAPAAAASAQSYPGNQPNGGVEAVADNRGDQVQGKVISRVDDPGALAFSGSDSAQLAGIGALLIVGGTVLVRRTRRTAPVPA